MSTIRCIRRGKNYELEPIEFPSSLLSIAIESAQKGDEEKLSVALHQVQEEDPTVIVEVFAGTKTNPYALPGRTAFISDQMETGTYCQKSQR